MGCAYWHLHDTDNHLHQIRLHWTFWRGERRLFIDDVLVNEDVFPCRWSSVQRHTLDHETLYVETRLRRGWPLIEATLMISGRAYAPLTG